uniref:Molybdopterin synthase sulfur carrier subunit n=1 Tax=Acrobeloides nanus TaxID=290746 RepID=A0A914CAC9_9BILA
MTYVNARLLTFGKVREIANVNDKEISVPSKIKCFELKKIIFQEILPAIQEMEKTCIIAVNQSYVYDEMEVLNLTDGCEIAVIPPISGG